VPHLRHVVVLAGSPQTGLRLWGGGG
jgi:hypothetical protein